MTREEKNLFIETLDGMLNENKNFYLTDTSGLNAEETSNLRALCYKREVLLKVVKNTLLKKAFERNDVDFQELYEVLKGNTSIMFSDSGNTAAKTIKEFRKKHKKPILKAAYIEDQFYIGDDNLDALSELKSKDELIADIMLLLQSPIKNLLSSLQSANNNLSGILKSLENNTESKK